MATSSPCRETRPSRKRSLSLFLRQLVAVLAAMTTEWRRTSLECQKQNQNMEAQ